MQFRKPVKGYLHIILFNHSDEKFVKFPKTLLKCVMWKMPKLHWHYRNVLVFSHDKEEPSDVEITFILMLPKVCKLLLLKLNVLDGWFVDQVTLYLGLVIFCGFVLFDTQLIVEKCRNGDDDFIWWGFWFKPKLVWKKKEDSSKWLISNCFVQNLKKKTRGYFWFLKNM